jgi:hypothetical protein
MWVSLHLYLCDDVAGIGCFWVWGLGLEDLPWRRCELGVFSFAKLLM